MARDWTWAPHFGKPSIWQQQLEAEEQRGGKSNNTSSQPALQLLRPSLAGNAASSTAAESSNKATHDNDDDIVFVRSARARSPSPNENSLPLHSPPSKRRKTTPTTSTRKSTPRPSTPFDHPLRRLRSSPAESRHQPQAAGPTAVPLSRSLATFVQGDADLMRAVRQRKEASTASTTDLSHLDVYMKIKGVIAVSPPDDLTSKVAATSHTPASSSPEKPHDAVQYLPSSSAPSTAVPPTQHTYTISLRGLQNHAVTAHLRTHCNVTLEEDCTSSTHYDLQLTTHPQRTVIFFKWSLLPAAMSATGSLDESMDLCAMLQRVPKGTTTLIVLEAYSSTGIVLDPTPPLVAAKETLENRWKEPGVRVCEACSPLEAALTARRFADECTVCEE